MSHAALFRKPFLHVFGWLTFIIYEISISWYFGDNSSLLAFGAFYILNIFLFYFNAHVIFFRFLSDNSFFRWVTLVLLTVIELAVYTYISTCLNNVFKHLKGVAILTHMNPDVVVMSIWRGVYFLGLSIAYWGVSSRIRAIKAAQQAEISRLKTLQERETLEKENIQLQNAYLQARINPHFLLNTLNFIYNQVEEINPIAADNIVLLSEIMQYSLSGMGKDGKVPLTQEIDHIRKYIGLNQSRFDNRLHLSTEIIGYPHPDKRIPPLLLLTFVENLFKHGDLTDPGHPGIIQVDMNNGQLLLFTKNKKRRFPVKHRDHVGISNARTRLYNFYGESGAHICIDQTETEFTLNLKIIL
ncbi:sensor histidine kinase [Compostibacter hankyongensis]|uniref:Signal transduction histidine kinase internal region domain-containing protein n=1 Tax=Compostibacter hankyongensis TaxID=1007089 RepID=A0ABP8FW89_9BACT